VIENVNHPEGVVSYVYGGGWTMTDYQQQINILIAETLDQFGSVPVHKVAQDPLCS
jgi:hypothetical protein